MFIIAHDCYTCCTCWHADTIYNIYILPCSWHKPLYKLIASGLFHLHICHLFIINTCDLFSCNKWVMMMMMNTIWKKILSNVNIESYFTYFLTVALYEIVSFVFTRNALSTCRHWLMAIRPHAVKSSCCLQFTENVKRFV